MENFENRDFEFDPIYSEYTPLSDDIKEEIQKLFKPEKLENTGFAASIIRKLMPCNLT